MKILLITFSFGLSSSGKITKRLSRELSRKGHEIVILTSSSDGEREPLKILQASAFPMKPARVFRSIGNLIQTDISFIFWQLRAYSLAKVLLKKFYPDLIYARSSPFCVFNVGLWLSRKYNIPLALHFADPVPATPDWHPLKRYRTKMTKTYLPAVMHAASLSFGNDEMLEYQQEIYNINLKHKSFILSDPIPEARILKPPSQDFTIFTFLGTFSENRNPKSLFDAFSILLKGNPLCELRIYGTRYGDISKYLNKYHYLRDRICIFDRTSDVDKVLEESTILVDVDADYDRPLFTSNKLKEYLAVNRLILSITPSNSPSHNLLKLLKRTCFVTDHKVTNVLNAIERAINTRWSDCLFSERELIRTSMGLTRVTQILEDRLSSLL